MNALLVGSPDMATHSGFILAEDEALKKYLSGMSVPTRPGDTSTTDVGVWFRYPESERSIKYPFITLDLLNVAPAFDLWTSDYIQNPENLYRPSVSPSVPDPDQGMGLEIRNYLAFRLTYQVSVHCRSSLHDRFLMSRFFTDVFPPRPFWLGVDTDNTWRRTELLDMAQSDLTETTESGNKRIFRKVYTISMLSEVPQDTIRQTWQVLRVFCNIYDRGTLDSMFTPELPVADFDNAQPPLATAAAEAANATITTS
jgi:hypothetical protein